MKNLTTFAVLILGVISSGCFLTDKAEWEGVWEPLFRTHDLVQALKSLPPDDGWVTTNRDMGLLFQRLDGTNVLACAAVFVQQLPRKNNPPRQLLKQFKATCGARVCHAEVVHLPTGEDAIQYELLSTDNPASQWRFRGLFVRHPKSEYHALDVFFSMPASAKDFDQQYELIGKTFVLSNLKAQQEAPTTPSSLRR